VGRVEQIKGKRGLTGLRAHDSERSFNGYTLFAPQGSSGEMYLIDMQGHVAHQWNLPHVPGQHGYITDEGLLFVNGRTVEESERFISRQPWKSGVVFEVNWDGTLIWELFHPDHHHDGIPLRNGNVLLMCLARLPEEITHKVQGGRPGSEHESGMYADYLVEMTREGETVWEWHSWEHLDPAAHPITSIQDHRWEWTHGNAVAEMPNGNILVSFRLISTVAIIDRQSGDIVWSLGAPPLAQQHSPTPLPNGNILIFDNGTHRLDHPFPYSRVIEVDPVTKEIVWQYQETFPMDFFSPHISSAQRLPNGNTLICEGSTGRIFEVTSDCQVCWEYVNPFFTSPPDQPEVAPNNRVYRAYRYGEDIISRMR
jgi:hypothetical protein